jgi:adenylosuccinate lyase
MAQRDVFDSISPVDYRYWDEEVATYLSENGFTRYKCRVELALVKALQQRGICDETVVSQVKAACEQVTTGAVYAEEKRIGHDIRALVNCICENVSDEAKRFVHMTATSFDISDTANAARYKDCIENVVVPRLIALHKVLAKLALREAETVQVGRTHGQHAVPITFGFAVASYVSRLGGCIQNLKRRAADLPGKFSGAVGAYNASHLFFDDPEVFEREVLAECGLRPVDHSTQIVQAEPLARLMFECTLAAGVMADLSDDMRHLQRMEIGEVGEAFGADQVGSSTMPQKRNPINFENAKSMWKMIVSRLTTILMDQLSEHQRDLTNSASARSYGEAMCYLVAMAKRLTRTMSKLEVDAENLRKNLDMQGDLIGAEPLYIALAALGHPDAHEAVRQVAQRARSERLSLSTAVQGEKSLEPYIVQMSDKQARSYKTPHQHYTGIAARRASEIAVHWSRELGYEL